MKVSEELYILELPMEFGGAQHILNVSLISDPHNGLSIVDTGLPGQLDLIEEAIEKEGFSSDQLKQIILTHQDLDHVGSLHPLKETTGATIYAYSVEIPYIDGSLPMVKAPSPERLATMPELAAIFAALKPTPVDISVEDGETLEKSANAQVVATPGHTPGHMSLYLPGTKTLVAGDALTSENGKLNGPNPQMTPNQELAQESLKKLLDLDVETIVCYHGGLVIEDANEQIRQLVGRD